MIKNVLFVTLLIAAPHAQGFTLICESVLWLNNNKVIRFEAVIEGLESDKAESKAITDIDGSALTQTIEWTAENLNVLIGPYSTGRGIYSSGDSVWMEISRATLSFIYGRQQSSGNRNIGSPGKCEIGELKI